MKSGLRNSVAWLALALSMGACQTKRNADYGADIKGVDASKLQTDGIAVVSWPCAGTGKMWPPNANSQEEYCEWTRAPEPYSGNGSPVGKVTVESVNLAKACIFTTSFDQTRKYFLTKRTVGISPLRREENVFYETFANSYAFLVGGREPDSSRERTGIIGHCIRGNGCTAPNCVPDRASDPQVCKALNTLGRKKCSVFTDFEIAPVINAGSVPAARHGDRVVKPQLTVRNTIADHCWFVQDPKMPNGQTNSRGEKFSVVEQSTLVACDAAALQVSNCDALANDLSVNVSLAIEDRVCMGGEPGPGPGVRRKPTPNPDSNPPVTPVGPGLVDRVFCQVAAETSVSADPKPGSQERVKIPAGTEVFVRGFVGAEFVSVQFKVSGSEFGAGVNLPSFVRRSEISAATCHR